MKLHAKRLSAWLMSHAGICIVLLFLTIHLFTINDYGYTWDFHFHFFGGGKLIGIEPKDLEPRNLPFVEPDPRNAWTLPYGPIMSIPPVASYLLLSQSYNVLGPDAAYHLPIILWGVLGIAVVYLFVAEAVNRKAAILASFFLALTPRYFGDMHNNMKDVPSAVIFAVNIWAIWRLVRHKRLIDFVLAIGAFAVAFNIKVNSIFIPLVFAAWLTHLVVEHRPIRISPSIKRAFIYFIFAPIAAFLLWWVFWPDPIGQLGHAFMTFGIGTNNIEVLLNGAWYCSGSTVPWYYPLVYLAITTPLPVLILFIIGAGIAVYSVMHHMFLSHHSRFIQKQSHAHPHLSMNYELYTLLLLWAFLPLSRYLLPSVGVIDGIRHFEEVLFPIAILAAIGLTHIARVSKHALATTLICIFSLLYLSTAVITYHPYQIAYFNELVGGAHGAFGKYDLDYWGTSQKAAILWVNEHAPQNAKVHIVMAAAVAGQYLRPDLVTNLNKFGYDESDFVILLNRQSFLYRFFYAYEYLLHHKPIHTIDVQGTPLTWIYDNRTDNKTPRQKEWWKDEDPCIIKYWRGERP